MTVKAQVRRGTIEAVPTEVRQHLNRDLTAVQHYLEGAEGIMPTSHYIASHPPRGWC